jgi:hypothetical protein
MQLEYVGDEGLGYHFKCNWVLEGNEMSILNDFFLPPLIYIRSLFQKVAILPPNPY